MLGSVLNGNKQSLFSEGQVSAMGKIVIKIKVARLNPRKQKQDLIATLTDRSSHGLGSSRLTSGPVGAVRCAVTPAFSGRERTGDVLRPKPRHSLRRCYAALTAQRAVPTLRTG